jgi:mycofactocin precursor peptide peptidase
VTGGLRTATWPEVAAAERRVLLLPTGSLEQHGPHLPLATDTLVAEAVAARVHAARPEVGLTPAIPVGASGEHEGFPGTVSIGTDALCNLVVEVVRFAAADWGRVVVVNGHGGNVDALRRAAQLCAQEGRPIEVVHLALAGMDAHAGRAETSMLLHLHPELVRTELAEAGATDPVADLLPALRAGGVRAVSPNGVLGDPTGASADEGARWVEGLVTKALAVVDGLLPPTVEP